MIGSRSIRTFDSIAAINAEYLAAIDELEPTLTTEHLDGAGARHFAATPPDSTRDYLASPPFTEDTALWTEGRESWKPPGRPDPITYKPLLVSDLGNEPERTSLRWLAGQQVGVPDELVLLCGLTSRLNATVSNWAYNNPHSADRSGAAARTVERERLLGLLDPAWGQPLGRYAVLNPGAFHHVDSWEALLHEHSALLAKLTSLTGEQVEDHHRYTNDPSAFEDRRRTKKNHLVGDFNSRTWQFPVEWIGDRGQPFGHDMSADELLWNMLNRSVRRTAPGSDSSQLLTQLVPEWSDGPPQRSPQLPLY